MIMNSDVLFGFDRSDLTTAGKQELDRLAGKIVPDSGVTVTGHTDWIGNVEYNQALSVRRAQTVANYLQSRVDAVYTVAGMGSQDPLEGTESCREDKNWNTLVACLAPNRRVVITVIK
jgi:outer membrane protein OmpA-like peptidoglycan-associated protein